ncbi:MAG: SMI1/KNR4 family protein [Deltaproteobacteria bacterium]|jgi:hypothetical protein|nr:SMI1/KNR4 family protein [Deltaproteobacteria bacterium]
MKITYLKNLKKTPIIEGIKNEGVSEEKIDALERKIGRKFPVAYREFLFLAGGSSGFFAQGDYGRFGELAKMQDDVKAELARVNLKMDKDFWAIAAFDGGEQFACFYWDEGDNPAVYDVVIWDDELEIKRLGKTFAKYVAETLAARDTPLASKRTILWLIFLTLLVGLYFLGYLSDLRDAASETFFR